MAMAVEISFPVATIFVIIRYEHAADAGNESTEI